MNSFLKSSVIGFLIGVAIYILINSMFNIEGMRKRKPNTQSDSTPVVNITGDDSNPVVKITGDDSNPVVNINGDNLSKYLIITRVNSISDLSDQEINDSDGISFSYPYTLLQINWDNLKSNKSDLYHSIQHDPVRHVRTFLTYFISQPSKIKNIHGDGLYIFIDFVDEGKETYLSFMTNLLKLIDTSSLKKLKIKAKGINKIFGNLDSSNITNMNLPALREIDLSGTNIGGRVSDIVNISNVLSLEKLYLSGLYISGNVNSLANMNPAVRVLDLSKTFVSGDISVFKDVKFLNLEKLNLSRTSVSGDIKVFDKFPKLEVLNLSHTSVSGDISVLEHVNFSNLEELYLTKTKVNGDISVLENVTFQNIKILTLDYNTDISGDISVLERVNFPSLMKFNIFETSVSVDISVLANVKFPILEELSLSYNIINSENTKSTPTPWPTPTLISGGVDLSGDNIRGDISVLEHVNFPNLKTLKFEKNKDISGDIKVFKKFPNLEVLELNETSVNGDISVLGNSNLSNLRVLDLSLTSVSGDITVFKKFPKLEVLELYATSVNGDISVLGNSNLSNLRVLDLSNTSVSGDISVIKEGNIQWKYLNISYTRISEWSSIGIIDNKDITATP